MGRIEAGPHDRQHDRQQGGHPAGRPARPPQGQPGHQGVLLMVLIALQVICVVFFVSDLIEDIREAGTLAGIGGHLVIELLANLTLIAAMLVELRFLRQIFARQAHAERALSVASGALHAVMEDHFRHWGLTPSESDVAAFTIKGCSIAEIARLRGSSEGTVKTHLNAIYRKSGLAGRGQLVSILIEDLLQADRGEGADRAVPHGPETGPEDGAPGLAAPAAGGRA